LGWAIRWSASLTSATTRLRRGDIFAVDANAYFSRSGPRLVEGLEIIAQLLHPELFPWTAPADAAATLRSAN
jgi:iron complex transport system substrate-binding protein